MNPPTTPVTPIAPPPTILRRSVSTLIATPPPRFATPPPRFATPPPLFPVVPQPTGIKEKRRQASSRHIKAKSKKRKLDKVDGGERPKRVRCRRLASPPQLDVNPSNDPFADHRLLTELQPSSSAETIVASNNDSPSSPLQEDPSDETDQDDDMEVARLLQIVKHVQCGLCPNHLEAKLRDPGDTVPCCANCLVRCGFCGNRACPTTERPLSPSPGARRAQLEGEVAANMKRGCAKCLHARGTERGVFRVHSLLQEGMGSEPRAAIAQTIKELLINYGLRDEAMCLYPLETEFACHGRRSALVAPKDLRFLGIGEEPSIVTGVIPAEHMTIKLYMKLVTTLPYLTHISAASSSSSSALSSRYLSNYPNPGEPVCQIQRDAPLMRNAPLRQAPVVREFALTDAQKTDVAAVRALVFGVGRGLSTDDFDVVVVRHA
jgi:hypothetical protein